MTRPIDALVAGHICFDVIPKFQKTAPTTGELFRPGSLVEMGPVTTSTGGPVSNTGIAMQRLGVKVDLMGKVSDDFIGKALLDRLAEGGLDQGMIMVPGEQTSYTVVVIVPGFDRIFLHCPGTNNTFGAEDVRLDVVEQSRHFHLGYPPLMRRLYERDGEQLAEIFRRAKEAGATTSLDMSLPDPAGDSGKVSWRKILENVLPHVDIYLPSAEETLFMLERDRYMATLEKAKGGDLLDAMKPEEIIALGEECIQHGPGVAVIKCGHRGIYIHTADQTRLDSFGAAKCPDGWANRELWEPSFHVENVAGATGSGDSAIAGFLSTFLRGLSLPEALRMANAVGGCNVTAPDALSGILPWAETRAKVAAGWKKNPLPLEGPGWTWNEEAKQWHGPNDRP